MNSPWTFEELTAMKVNLLSGIHDMEEKYPDARPLPPMTVSEALELINALIGAAGTRPLTREELFLHGQLLSVYRMALTAETLGYKGRCFVLTEDDMKRMSGIEVKP